MSDSYQAIYDATRSRISNGDIGRAVESVLREANLSHYVERAFYDAGLLITEAVAQHKRPCVLFRPSLSIDGNKYCALYGSNLMDGIAGFGDSAEEALADFDLNFAKKLPANLAAGVQRGR